ncbi:MAG: 4-hydroxy-tetrahydrodipicolinate reductase [Syntrophomonadaceae bacterium]|nr:4-hydroxy-tetrahydrodipicolinate reductase [Syntrophomonadaceae bacterium]
MTKVGLIGLGKTGSIVAQEILKYPEFQLVMCLVGPGSRKAGSDLGELLGIGRRSLVVKEIGHLEEELQKNSPDVLVDFTSPEACLKNLRTVLKQDKPVPIIIGTTGFDDEQVQTLKRIPQQYRLPIIFAPNMTLGINVLLNLAVKAAEVLSSWDIEIIDTHHRYKKDAPSGTAIKIGRILADCLDRAEDAIVFGHERLGQRIPGKITIQAIRGGGVIGVHQVIFLSENEKLEIRHESLSRSAFVDCLAHLLRFAVLALPGFYTVEEVLGLAPPTKKPEHGSQQAEIA